MISKVELVDNIFHKIYHTLNILNLPCKTVQGKAMFPTKRVLEQWFTQPHHCTQTFKKI